MNSVTTDGKHEGPRLRFAIALLIYAWSAAWILAHGFPGRPPGNDSAYYLVAAKGFAEGHPFSDPSHPDPSAGALLGPSAFPMLLSLYWRFLHPHLGILKVLIALAMAAAPPFAFLWLRAFLSLPAAILAAASFGCSYAYIVQGDSIMTECLFTPLLWAGLWLSTGEEPRDSRRAVTAALLWAVSARTRVIGWIFLAVFSGKEAMRRRWISLAAGWGLALAWVGVERVLARGLRVMHYTDGMWTSQYPILTDPARGIALLWRGLSVNLSAFAGAIDAHLLLPGLYEAAAMDRTKHLLCVAVFLWTAAGAALAWKRRPALRPWLAAAIVANGPTFLIFESHDAFRYLMPFLPILFLAWAEPFFFVAERKPAWRPLPVAALALVLAAQAAGSWRHDFESEYIDYPDEHAALQRSILALPHKPDLCLAADSYYTWLETGCPSLQFWGHRHPWTLAREYGTGKETWAICGPRNQYHCDSLRAMGMVFGEPVIHTAHDWTLSRVEAWPKGP